MKSFKKLLAAMLAATMLTGVNAQAEPAEDTTSNDEDAAELAAHWHVLAVEGTELNTSALPFSAYEVGGDDVYDLMVPLRIVAEALGYLVAWDAQTEVITVDDGIRIMMLTDGCMEVVLVGKFGDHSSDGKLPIAFPVKIHDGHTYVPLSLVRCMLTETRIYENYVIINKQHS